MPDIVTFPYTAVQLSQQVNRIPNNYGLINALNIFPSSGSMSTLVEVRRNNFTLSVLPARERGAPASAGERKLGDLLIFEVPHFPHDDLIGPRDLQNMLMQVGDTMQFRTLDFELAERLVTIRNKHAITREWLRMSALKGQIMDGTGAVLYDLYASFGFTRNTIYFDLANTTTLTDINAKCSALLQSVSTNLLGETMTKVRVIVSTAFMDAFIGHPKLEKYYLNWQASNQLSNVTRKQIGEQYGRIFDYQGIEWVEYLGIAPVKVAGTMTAVPFVEVGKGYGYPVGTMSTFATYDAPPDDIRVVNQRGTELHISPKILDHGKGVELHTESNPLPICKRPEVLVTVDMGPHP